jgi:cytochrome c peroxidase
MDPIEPSRCCTRRDRPAPKRVRVQKGDEAVPRTESLRGLWQHPPYFHDGSAADLPAVVDHYDTYFGLGLSVEERADLVEFLKSL